MTITSKIQVSGGNLVVHGKTILTGVPKNIELTHVSGAGLADGAFVGATADEPKSIHIFPFGTLRSFRGMMITPANRTSLFFKTTEVLKSCNFVPHQK